MLSLLSLAALPLLASAQYGDYPTASSSTPVAAAMASMSPTSMAIPAVQTVIVGGGPLMYAPNFVNAVVGSKIIFQFESKNHTLFQSSFATPCQYVAGGLNSGYVPAMAGGPYPTYEITVTDISSPLWFYCGQGSHCPLGMVFAINPTAAQTVAMFISNAESGANSTIGSVSLTGHGVNAVSAAVYPPSNTTSTSGMAMATGASMSSAMMMPSSSSSAASVIPAAASTTAKSSATKTVVGGFVAGLVGLVGLFI